MKNIGMSVFRRLICALGLLFVFAFAASDPPAVFADTQGVLTYTLNGTDAEITGCDTNAADIDVVDAFAAIAGQGYTVTSIGNNAFAYCFGLTSIDIPESVTSIGYSAFFDCSGLAIINIPNSVTSIDSLTFYGCTGLTSIDIPESVTSIGVGAFYDCTGLASIDIPNSVTSIGDNAFFDCTGLTSIDIPDSVTSIGMYAFYGCTGLTSIDIPDSVTSIGMYAFYDCTGLTSVTIPSGVTSIDSSVFYYCTGLTSIDIPNSVTSIGSNAFYGCTGLTSVIIPNSVASIDDRAFYDCLGLTSVIIPNSVASIGVSAFLGCTGLTSIDIPENVKSISEQAFYGCTSLAAITANTANAYFATDSSGVLFSKDMTLLIQYPAGNPQSNYIVPAGVTSIGNYAFSECIGLTSIDIPESVTIIGNNAFSGCTGLTGIDIPVGVTNIGDYTFYRCTGLTSIDIPNSVTSIGINAFYLCTGLTSIDIPESVTSIGGGAFSRSAIEKLHIPASVTTMDGMLGAGSSGMPNLEAIIFSHGTEHIPEYTFRGTFPNPVDVYIPDSVTSIDPDAITGLTGDLIIRSTANNNYIKQWADTNSLSFISINNWITKDNYEDAWRLVPYQYIIETNRAENENLSFEVVGGALPAGLTLLPDGQFHGAPLETGTFTFDAAVYFTLLGNSEEYLMDLQEIKLRVEEPGDAELAATNDYDIGGFIGEPAVPGVTGNYVLIGPRAGDGLDDQVFRVEDILHGSPTGFNNFEYFVAFWLDGRMLTSGSAIYPSAEYIAEDGSTVVTVYAKTFQNLNNGEHTAAAEFMIPDPEGGPKIQKVAAQKFKLELTDPPKEDTPKEDIPPAVNEPEEPRPENTPAGGSGRVQTTPVEPPPAEAPSAPAWDNPFGDVSESDWFYEDVLYAVENELMNGTSATSFSPQTPMTRGMIITVLGRLAGADEDASASGGFSDIETGAYYTPYVAWAAANGLVSGTGAGGFAPNEDVTRQDLATLIARYAEFAGLSVPPLRSAESFDDDAQTADYAKDALQTLTAGGILNGKPGNIFDPRGGATRAETAAILHRFIEATK